MASTSRPPKKPHRVLWGFFLFSALCTASCATLQGRREDFIAHQPGLTDGQKNAIRRGELLPGMTPGMVEASWGKPLDEIHEVLGGQEVTSWLYQQSVDDLLKTFRVRFAEGAVAEVKLINVQQKVYSPFYRRYYWRYYPEWVR